MEWIFLTALEVNMDCALCDARPVHNVQRHLEDPEQRILALEPGSCGFEELSISDSDGDAEHYETVGLHLAVRPVVHQKLKHEQPMAQEGHPRGAPSVTESTIYCHIFR